MFNTNFGYRTFLEAAQNRSNRSTVNWVVTTDIADFYPRIYSHTLRNTLPTITGKARHVDALLSFLSQINQSVSYGLPVGPSGSRLLAELTLTDVDRLLQTEGIDFVRFVDDYRLFCRTERQAYEALAALANALFESHGLSLQQHKTSIMSKEDYLRSIAPDEEDLERGRLSSQFEAIVNELGLDNAYEPIDYDSLDDGIKTRVDELNLLGILQEQLDLGAEMSVLTLRFVLRRLAQLREHAGLGATLASPRVLYLVLKEFSDYVVSLRREGVARVGIGRRILRLLNDPVLGHLALNRVWLLNCFARDNTLNSAGEFVRLINSHQGDLERRELILALGAHSSHQWLRMRKRSVGQERRGVSGRS
jgi:hypothetical protein